MFPTSYGLNRRQTASVVVYACVVAALAWGSLETISDLWVKLGEVATVQKQLDRLSKHSPGPPLLSASDAVMGSPLLDGSTVTIAGAALQQRVQQAVTKAGGVLSSSQVDLDGPDAAKGLVYLTATVEINQPAIQTVLYDVEAGMPYLFVDKLSILSPKNLGEPESGKMRMTIRVAGQWGPSE
jgi:general secretion pathway protein M